MDPTTKEFIIAGCLAAIPSTVTGLFNHWKIRDVEHKVDGMNEALRAEKNQAVSDLAASDKQLSRAEGVKEGSDAERAIHIKIEDSRDKTATPVPVTITDKSVPVNIVDKEKGEK